jgi:hypothetical protein
MRRGLARSAWQVPCAIALDSRVAAGFRHHLVELWQVLVDLAIRRAAGNQQPAVAVTNGSPRRIRKGGADDDRRMQ